MAFSARELLAELDDFLSRRLRRRAADASQREGATGVPEPQELGLGQTIQETSDHTRVERVARACRLDDRSDAFNGYVQQVSISAP